MVQLCRPLIGETLCAEASTWHSQLGRVGFRLIWGLCEWKLGRASLAHSSSVSVLASFVRTSATRGSADGTIAIPRPAGHYQHSSSIGLALGGFKRAKNSCRILALGLAP